MSDAPSIEEKLPDRHFKHALIEVAPSTLEYVPAGHFRHPKIDTIPTLVLYVPIGHLPQLEVPDAYSPT